MNRRRIHLQARHVAAMKSALAIALALPGGDEDKKPVMREALQLLNDLPNDWPSRGLIEGRPTAWRRGG